MASLMQTVNTSVAQVVGSIGAIGGVVSKNMLALDRASDASYSHADTFVKNTLLRNEGSLKDTVLDEEERDHERLSRRIKFDEARTLWMADHPEIVKAARKPVKAKPATRKTRGKAAPK
jgi:hypothetical protein